jgi:exosortase/archaeosortase family protein
MTALLGVAVLMSALLLRTVVARTLFVLLAIPIAIVINGVRVFITGFLVFFASPALGRGFMHQTEGLLLFLVSMGSLALAAKLGLVVERAVRDLGRGEVA